MPGPTPARSDPALRASRRGLARVLTSGVPALALTLLSLSGCQSELDMAKAFDERRAATTISYAAVGEAHRQFPDYSPIRAEILKSPPARSPAAGETPPSKPRRP
jgi:hypothetical protein